MVDYNAFVILNFWIIYFCVGWCSSINRVSGYGLKDGGLIFNWAGKFLVVIIYQAGCHPGNKMLEA
jgi:hypothetical protein